ncbi:hypothetical protein DIPPA_01527 [Diplonema papillatum]|nr:hypothetical protein DIPPA_01527 [Diplonema papillatum]
MLSPTPDGEVSGLDAVLQGTSRHGMRSESKSRGQSRHGTPSGTPRSRDDEPAAAPAAACASRWLQHCPKTARGVPSEVFPQHPSTASSSAASSGSSMMGYVQQLTGDLLAEKRARREERAQAEVLVKTLENQLLLQSPADAAPDKTRDLTATIRKLQDQYEVRKADVSRLQATVAELGEANAAAAARAAAEIEQLSLENDRLRAQQAADRCPSRAGSTSPLTAFAGLSAVDMTSSDAQLEADRLAHDEAYPLRQHPYTGCVRVASCEESARRAGIRENDVILAVAGIEIASVVHLQVTLAALGPTSPSLDLQYRRGAVVASTSLEAGIPHPPTSPDVVRLCKLTGGMALLLSDYKRHINQLSNSQETDLASCRRRVAQLTELLEAKTREAEAMKESAADQAADAQLAAANTRLVQEKKVLTLRLNRAVNDKTRLEGELRQAAAAREAVAADHQKTCAGLEQSFAASAAEAEASKGAAAAARQAVDDKTRLEVELRQAVAAAEAETARLSGELRAAEKRAAASLRTADLSARERNESDSDRLALQTRLSALAQDLVSQEDAHAASVALLESDLQAASCAKAVAEKTLAAERRRLPPPPQLPEDGGAALVQPFLDAQRAVVARVTAGFGALAARCERVAAAVGRAEAAVAGLAGAGRRGRSLHAAAGVLVAQLEQAHAELAVLRAQNCGGGSSGRPPADAGCDVAQFGFGACRQEEGGSTADILLPSARGMSSSASVVSLRGLPSAGGSTPSLVATPTASCAEAPEKKRALLPLTHNVMHDFHWPCAASTVPASVSRQRPPPRGTPVTKTPKLFISDFARAHAKSPKYASPLAPTYFASRRCGSSVFQQVRRTDVNAPVTASPIMTPTPSSPFVEVEVIEHHPRTLDFSDAGVTEFEVHDRDVMSESYF